MATGDTEGRLLFYQLSAYTARVRVRPARWVAAHRPYGGQAGSDGECLACASVQYVLMTAAAAAVSTTTTTTTTTTNRDSSAAFANNGAGVSLTATLSPTFGAKRLVDQATGRVDREHDQGAGNSSRNRPKCGLAYLCAGVEVAPAI